MTDERATDAPRPSTDAVTTGSITGTGTGGLGSAGGTDTTPDVSSTPAVLEQPEPTSSPLDEAVERGGETTD
jgi:hypothetical protein